MAKRTTAHGIRACTPRRSTRATDSDHGLPVAPEFLARCFEPSGPNRSWGADITCPPTAEGWPDPAAVEDPFRRMAVGWLMAATVESRLVVDAVEMAIVRRRPDAGPPAHSGRGRQYASDHSRRVSSALRTPHCGTACGSCRRPAAAAGTPTSPPTPAPLRAFGARHGLRLSRPTYRFLRGDPAEPPAAREEISGLGRGRPPGTSCRRARTRRGSRWCRRSPPPSTPTRWTARRMSRRRRGRARRDGGRRGLPPTGGPSPGWTRPVHIGGAFEGVAGG